MRFASLEAFGLHPRLVSGWEADLGPELLPAQEKAVRAGVLEGHSVVAVAPGGAGKTLVAEMALGRAALRQGKGLYLSPTRALAEQKRAELLARFGPLGLKVAISTRDHWEADGAILRGDFDLVVAVPEKARALLAQNPALVSGIAVVVADEVHLLGDRERGAALEVLLADLRGLGEAQIVALTAAACNAGELAEWLGARLVVEERRPVELRAGVLLEGEFAYREHNGRRWGRERLEGAGRLGEGWAGGAAGLALGLAREGEATIVFVRDKPSANRLAALMGADSGLAPAPGLAARLEGCADTASVRMLRDLAGAGVGVHHADLQAAERLAVEEALAAGELLLVVATSSLALGVNLPARNVIVDPVQWRPPSKGDERASQGALPLVDFLAMAGRAGRLRYAEAFGRAVLLADTELQRDALVATYIEAPEPPVEPALLAMEEEDVAVALGTGLLAADRGVARAWQATLSARKCTGPVQSRRTEGEPQDRLPAVAERLAETGLMDAATLRPTPKLRAAAGATADAATLAWMARLADSDPAAADWLDLLALACTAPYMRRAAFPLSRVELRECDFARELAAVAEDRGLGGSLLAALMEEPELSLTQRQRAGKMVLAIMAWASGLSPAEVEERVRIPAGRLEAVAGSAAWLMQVAAEMAGTSGWSKSAVQRLADAARAVRLGLPVGSICGDEESGALPATAAAAPDEALVETRPSLGQEGMAVERAPAAGAEGRDVARPSRARRRATADASQSVLELDERHPDRLVLSGRRVVVRPMEFRLMWRLAEDAGACVAWRELVAFMMGPGEWEGSHQLYPHVKRLRRAIGESGAAGDPRDLLMTVPKEGLRLNLNRREVVLRRREAAVEA